MRKYSDGRNFSTKELDMMESWLNCDYYPRSREPNYQGLQRKIIVEETLRDSSGDLPNDFKLFCYEGRVFMIQVDLGRFGVHKRQLYTRNWDLLPYCMAYPRESEPSEKEPGLEKAIEIAEKLSEPFSFCRVCLLYTSPSPRDQRGSRMPSSA